MDRRKFILTTMAAGVTGSALSACGSTANSNNLAATKGKIKAQIMPLAERQKWLQSFSCNIEMWFKHLPFVDRITAAKAMGFDAVEFWNPIQPKKGKTPELIAKRAKDEGITITSFSPGAPNLGDMNNHNKFIEWTKGAIELCDVFNVPNFNLTGHKNIEGQSEQQNIDIYTQAIKLAAPIFEKAKVVATIEPYNPFNHPGYFINGVEPGLSICREVNSPSIKLNWDFFHMQRTNGNLITHMENGVDQIGYVQLADSPSRHQPGTEEISYGPVLLKLRELGYKSYIGAECFPKNKNDLQAANDLANLAKNINLSSPK